MPRNKATSAICIGLIAASLTACVEDGNGNASRAPNAAEQACLAAVSRETQNATVALVGSEFSEAGTYVRVAVGAQRAPWKCIAYKDGTTAGIEFLGSDSGGVAADGGGGGTGY